MNGSDRGRNAVEQHVEGRSVAPNEGEEEEQEEGLWIRGLRPRDREGSGNAPGYRFCTTAGRLLR